MKLLESKNSSNYFFHIDNLNTIDHLNRGSSIQQSLQYAEHSMPPLSTTLPNLW